MIEFFVSFFIAIAAIEVAVDVKPQSCPNPLNVYKNGVIPVAILGSEEFDVNNIETVSVERRAVTFWRCRSQ